MMRALVIAIGNRLRRDDGVAHAVRVRDAESRALLQLTPEVAEDIAGYDPVIFIDSDAGAVNLSIESLDWTPSAPVFSHVVRPAEIVGLSRALFGFAGRAFLCRIPVDDLSIGEGLSRRVAALAAQATEELEDLLVDLRVGPR